MIINEVDHNQLGIQVSLTLLWHESYKSGPIDITARWRAAGAWLLREGEIRTEGDTREYALTAIRAGVTGLNRRYKETQQFQLSFKVTS